MNIQTNRSEILAGLLRGVGPDKPSDDFTSIVMNEVTEETARKSEFALLLQGQGLDEPSTTFVTALAVKLGAPQLSEVRPVISRTAWIAIAAFLLITISLVIIQDNNTVSPTGATPYMVNLGTSLQKVLSLVPLPYLVTIFGFAMLLLADYLLTKRRLAAPKD